MVLSSAILWHSAYADLSSLDNKSWIESTVADFYLTSIWHGMHGNAPCRFVMIFRDSHNLQVPLEVFDRYRHTHYVPANEPCPIVPVAFLVHDPQSAHFFAVIFDYTTHMAYVFGRRLGDHNPQYDLDWKAWRGPERWKIIADLHFWDTGDPEDVLVIIRDWPQNGYDCGPISCALIQKCIEDGIEVTWESLSTVPIGSRPPIPCGHILRLNMLAHVRQHCMTSFNDYMHFLVHSPPHWDYMELDNETTEQMQNGGDLVRDNRLLRSLTLASSTCMDCHAYVAQHPASKDRKRKGRGDDRDQEDQDDSDQEQEQQEGSLCNPDRAKALLSLIKGYAILRGTHLHRSLRPFSATGHPPRTRTSRNEEVGDVEQEQEINRGQLSTAARASRKEVRDWRLGTIGRFSRRSKPVPLEAYRGRRFIPHDYEYDEYDDGPTLEMLQQPEVYSILTHPYKQMTQAPSWIMWRDHGYRILIDSFQMFYLARPVQIMDHIMVIGNVDLPESNNPVAQVRYHPPIPISLILPNDDVQDDDNDDPFEIMSAREMLDYAGSAPWINQSYSHGCNMFVQGHLPIFGEGQKYVRVDLEQDRVDFSVDDIQISIDIDSIIWVTRKLVCSNSVGVYLTPIYDGKSGIHKHNHVYVEILIPQSEEDQRALGHRTEWLSKKFPLSAIPHTTIGQLASSTGHVLWIYIFFPRMIHRSPHNGRRMNIMSKDVLDLFWEEIFLPAIYGSSTESSAPYYSESLEEARYKQRGSSGGRKTLPISNTAFMDIQRRMKEFILEHADADCSRYGSFFFVVEGKGIKLLTKDGQGVYVSPELALRRNLSCLDWDHMLDRHNGELIIDVGVSFTPMTREPVVGLWRLDSLEESYAAAGFNKGIAHHHFTLHNYGALQAEMPQDRALHTHVAFRNTYNLYYEAIRPSNNMPAFFSDSQAYGLSEEYYKECSGMIKIFRKVKSKTYGVRDEYRVSGQAAQVLLDQIIPQVLFGPSVYADADHPYFRPRDICNPDLFYGFLRKSGLSSYPEGWRKYKELRSS